jgi:signal peptidase I
MSNSNARRYAWRKIGLTSIVVLIALCGATIFYGKLFFNFVRVPVGSMANTIIPGDHLVIKTRAYGDIARGNVVVFKYPGDDTNYIGRVVGLPQETILVRERFVYINGERLEEERVTVDGSDLLNMEPLPELSKEGTGPYRVYYVPRIGNGLDAEYLGDGGYGVEEPYRIPENRYFLMGDNRDNSHDSRHRGTVPRGLIVGKSTIIYWSSLTDETGNEIVKWDRIFTTPR